MYAYVVFRARAREPRGRPHSHARARVPRTRALAARASRDGRLVVRWSRHRRFPGESASLSLGNADFNRWVKHGKTAREASSTDGARDDGRGNERAGSSRASSRNDARHRFKTPYMTVDDLKKGPKPWREFLCARRGDARTPCRGLDGVQSAIGRKCVRVRGELRAHGVIFGCVNLYKNPGARRRDGERQNLSMDGSKHRGDERHAGGKCLEPSWRGL